jgi:hypothetical protein
VDASFPCAVTSIMCSQDYQEHTGFKLAARETSGILFLQVANVTYVQESPLSHRLRSRELLVVQQKTEECGMGKWDLCFVSACLLDR